MYGGTKCQCVYEFFKLPTTQIITNYIAKHVLALGNIMNTFCYVHLLRNTNHVLHEIIWPNMLLLYMRIKSGIKIKGSFHEQIEYKTPDHHKYVLHSNMQHCSLWHRTAEVKTVFHNPKISLINSMSETRFEMLHRILTEIWVWPLVGLTNTPETDEAPWLQRIPLKAFSKLQVKQEHQEHNYNTTSNIYRPYFSHVIKLNYLIYWNCRHPPMQYRCYVHSIVT